VIAERNAAAGAVATKSSFIMSVLSGFGSSPGAENGFRGSIRHSNNDNRQIARHVDIEQFFASLRGAPDYGRRKLLASARKPRLFDSRLKQRRPALGAPKPWTGEITLRYHRDHREFGFLSCVLRWRDRAHICCQRRHNNFQGYSET
jgi:hypothetical protein